MGGQMTKEEVERRTRALNPKHLHLKVSSIGNLAGVHIGPQTEEQIQAGVMPCSAYQSPWSWNRSRLEFVALPNRVEIRPTIPGEDIPVYASEQCLRLLQWVMGSNAERLTSEVLGIKQDHQEHVVLVRHPNFPAMSSPLLKKTEKVRPTEKERRREERTMGRM